MAHRVRGFLRVGAGAAAHGDADAELARRAVGPGAVRRADRHAARRHHHLPPGVLRDDDRTLVPGQEHELQRRLAMVLQRTLRRQAQEFLERPFTQRRCRLYEYAMSDDERSLYDDVTEYLLRAVAVSPSPARSAGCC